MSDREIAGSRAEALPQMVSIQDREHARRKGKRRIPRPTSCSIKGSESAVLNSKGGIPKVRASDDLKAQKGDLSLNSPAR